MPQALYCWLSITYSLCWKEVSTAMIWTLVSNFSISSFTFLV